MCCFFAALFALGPRIGILILWLTAWGSTKMNLAFDGWILPLLGWFILPWVTLMYIFVFPVTGIWDWLWLGLALLADLASYSGGVRTRQSVPGYPGP